MYEESSDVEASICENKAKKANYYVMANAKSKYIKYSPKSLP